MRLCAPSIEFYLLAASLLATSSGCVATARPTPAPVPTAVASAPQVAGAVRPEVPPETPSVPTVPPPPETAPSRPRLAWVNPARCLTSCDFEPTPELVRINAQGEPDAKGRFRLVADTQVALVALLQAAHAAGHALRIESAYRSYRDQARLYADTKEPGRAARPGHSEHQLGTVADLRLPTSAAIDWLAAHAHDFGFALSYPPSKQKLTGYRPEPWHVRYVGRELATELYDKKLILEEYFRSQPGLGESGTCTDCPLPASQAACGDATPEGACDGTLLIWCYDGTLATVDCKTTAEQCGRIPGSAQHDCLPKSDSAGPAERDESSVR